MKDVDLSSSLSSNAGKVVGSLFYDGVLDCLLIREEYSGYPNSGMEHSLFLRLGWGDLLAFFELIEELYSRSNLCKRGINELKKKAGLPVYI